MKTMETKWQKGTRTQQHMNTHGKRKGHKKGTGEEQQEGMQPVKKIWHKGARKGTWNK